MILDTTFVIDLLDEDPAAIETVEELVEARSRTALSSVTVFEVGVGLDTGERERFDEIVDTMVVLPLGLEETRQAVGIQRSLGDAGRPIGVIDALIAGTATASDDPVVLTRNVGEFERVDDLDVETY